MSGCCHEHKPGNGAAGPAYGPIGQASKPSGADNMTALGEACRAVMALEWCELHVLVDVPDCNEGWGHGRSVAQLAALAPVLRDLACKALLMLEKLEWVGMYGEAWHCQECGSVSRNAGHDPDCALAALLADATEKLRASAPKAGGAG